MSDEENWWHVRDRWRYADPLDDRPDWDRESETPPLRVCRRCGVSAELDPLRHCGRCRTALGRCQWCGLDPAKYKRMDACATCYRWLNSNLDQVGYADAFEQLMVNAVARYKRRVQRS